MKKLVAYFSATGVTESIAVRMAGLIGADLFRIEPKEPYTIEDLNWSSKKSRSSLEMHDLASRPELKETIDVTDYDVLFVGFPIWWFREPRIIDTFIESLDLAGKVVVPFATSSGSGGIGDVSSNLLELAPEAEVTCGRCFPVTVSDGKLKAFAERQCR